MGGEGAAASAPTPASPLRNERAKRKHAAATDIGHSRAAGEDEDDDDDDEDETGGGRDGGESAGGEVRTIPETLRP
jgi:hypothetical protein